MQFRLSAILAVTCVVVAVPAMAHHSFNTFFDMSRTLEIEGVVKSFSLRSPHSEMMIEVSDAGGEVATWRITARTGAVNAKREGWKPEEFIGKMVKVQGNPTRRGRRHGYGCRRGHIPGRQGCVSGRLPGRPPDRVTRRVTTSRYDKRRTMMTGLRRVARAGALFALVMAVGTVDVAAQSDEEYENIYPFLGHWDSQIRSPEGQDRGNCGGRLGDLGRKANELFHASGQPSLERTSGSLDELRGYLPVTDDSGVRRGQRECLAG